MDKQKWADKEIQLFCNEFKDEDEKDEYIRACIDAAILSLTVYSVILKDEKTDSNLTLSIVEQLSKGLPLTPIMNREDDWELLSSDRVPSDENYKKIYRCTRYHKLYRGIKKDDSITYFEMERVKAYDMDHLHGFTGQLFTKVVEELYPITFPYVPTGTYKVFCDRFFSGERKDGQDTLYNTMCIRAVMTPDGERTSIMKFYKMDSPVEYGEIKATEFFEREKKRERRNTTNKETPND